MSTPTPSSTSPPYPPPPPPPPSSSALPRRPPPIAPPRRRGTVPLVALVTLFFAFPFAYIQYHNRKQSEGRKGHYLSKEAMPPSAAIRGAYLNSGSKDVGYDDEYYKKHGEAVKHLHDAHHGRREGE